VRQTIDSGSSAGIPPFEKSKYKERFLAERYCPFSFFGYFFLFRETFYYAKAVPLFWAYKRKK
jgi:hypothetical protein